MTTAAPAASPPPPALPLLRGYNPLARRVEERHGFPVLPGGFPLLGHLPAIAVDELGFLRDAERRLGSLFYVSFGFGNYQLVHMGKDALTLFRNKGADSSYMREGGGVTDVFGQSVLVHDGPVHHHLRSAMNGPFQPRGLAEARVGEIVAELVDRCVRRWAGRTGVRVLADTRELTLSVMFRLVGVEDEELAAWRVQYEDLLLLLVNFPLRFPGSPHDRGLKARAWLDERLRVLLARARTKEDAPGLLPGLLRSRDENGEPLSDAELVDNLRVIFLAGHETSATTMAWLVAHLAERPDVWRRLRDEAQAAADLPRSPRDLRQFPYAEALFRETLRLHPPVPHDTRRTSTDLEIAGRRVKRGTRIAIPILTLSRDPDAYPDPDAFRPERWLARTEPPTALEMVQFAAGPHFCLGYHLAWLEIVAFAVALGRALPAAGPRLEGGFPATRYLPLSHPDAAMAARFD
jgi:cytochrome P450